MTTTVRGMAVSVLVAPWLDGPAQELEVAQHSRLAFSVAGPDGRVAFAVTFPGAVRLPYSCAVPTSEPSRSVPRWVRVGAGSLSWGDVDRCVDVHRVRRWWRPARPRPEEHPNLRARYPVDDSAVRQLQATWRDSVGRGPGLTPYADDVLCGALITLHAVGHPSLPDLSAAVSADDLERRTTATSAALVRAACQGWCIDQLADLLQTLDHADASELSVCRDRLLAVGSSSGRGLLEGVEHVLGPIPRREAA